MIQRILLVEDEPPARRRLQRMLEELVPGIEVVEAEDARSARASLADGQFDGILLDVQLPDALGIELGRELRSGPPVVFVTASREHAVEAFEVRAVDYLVKPVDPARLSDALERMCAEERSPMYCLRTSTGTRFVSRDEVTCVLGQGDYTEVWLDDGTSELVDVPMYTWEQRLGGMYVRVHRSSLVRLDALSALRRSVTGTYSLEVHGVPRPIKISRQAVKDLRGRFLQ